VLQAGLLGETGKVYVLDMGEPVAISDLAKDMITLSGLVPERDIEIRETGIRPGEKLFEELFNASEITRTEVHSKVLEAMQGGECLPDIEKGLEALRAVLSIDSELERKREILNQFMKLVPSYVPSALGLGRHLEHPLPATARIH
jgi:FlaA1/EpsC-like NDP-sugar epimerase